MVRKGLSSLIGLFLEYEVLFDASNGEDLIRQLKPDMLPDIVMLDIVMPGMDGFATARWLKENYPQVKVLALSSMDSEASILKMIRSGSSGYVLKDAEPKELKMAFDEILAKGYYCNELVSRKIIHAVASMDDGNDDTGTLVRLSDRELIFLNLACSERTYNDIAKEMYVSERTVDGYRDALFKKLGVSTRVGLAVYAIKHDLVKL